MVRYPLNSTGHARAAGWTALAAVLAVGPLPAQGLLLGADTDHADARAQMTAICGAATSSPTGTELWRSTCAELDQLFRTREPRRAAERGILATLHQNAMVGMVRLARRDDLSEASVGLLALFPSATAPFERWHRLPPRVEPLVPTMIAAARQMAVDRDALRGCATVSLEVREYPAARWCLHQGLALGTDSTWMLLRLAWLDYQRDSMRTADTLLGRALTAGRDSADRVLLVGMLDYLGRNHNRARADRERWSPDSWNAFLQDQADSLDLLERVVVRIADEAIAGHALVARSMRELGVWGIGFRSCPDMISPTGLVDHACAHAVSRGDGSAIIPAEERLEARAFQLWDPGTGDPITVIGFRSTELANAAAAHPDGHVELVTREWNAARPDHLVEQTDTLALARLRGGGAVSILSAPHGVGAWSLWLRGNAPLLFRAVHDGDVPTPIPERISDLLVADADVAPVWPTAGEPILVPTTVELSQASRSRLFFQLRAAQADSILVQLRVTSVERAAAGITLTFPLLVSAGIVPVHRELDLSRLDRGDYRVTVVVSATGRLNGAATSTRILLK